MKIVIDVRPLQIGHQYRGIGTYLKNLLPLLLKEGKNNEFIFLRYKFSNPLEDIKTNDSLYEEVIISREKSSLEKASYKNNPDDFSEIKKLKPDIFIQPDQNLGLPKSRKIKKVVIVYDLIPLILRDYYLPDWKKILFQPGISRKKKPKKSLKAWLDYRKYNNGLESLKRADKIISISESTTEDLVDILKIPEKKIVTTPLASTISSDKEPKKPLALKNLKNPYLLFIGGIDPRRKIADLVTAFNLVNGRGHKIDLVMAGKELSDVKKIPNEEGRNAIFKSSYKEQIHLLGYVSEVEKVWLYKNAFVFVYPTIYEGFGLPVIEAMALGCPVITYKNSSLTEIAEGGSVLLDQPGFDGIYSAVLELIENKDKRELLIKSGKANSRKFDWVKTANKTSALLKDF